VPVYEFLCQGCQKEFSLVMSMRKRKKKKPACPHCGGKKARQLISAFQPITSKKS